MAAMEQAGQASERPDAPQEPRGPGRPTKLDDFMLELAEKAGKAGLIDEQVATMLGIAVSTYYAWLKDHPEFSEALKRGMTDPAARVRMSLYQRAIGYNVPEEKVFLHEGKPVRVATFRHVVASDTALIFWLCNKLPEEFKHIQHIQNSGGVDVNLKNTIPAAWASQMDRVLAAMGEKPVGRAPAPKPAPAAAKPRKPAVPVPPDDLDEEEIPLEPSPIDEDPNPPSDLDLSELESGDE